MKYYTLRVMPVTNIDKIDLITFYNVVHRLGLADFKKTDIYSYVEDDLVNHVRSWTFVLSFAEILSKYTALSCIMRDIFGDVFYYGIQEETGTPEDIRDALVMRKEFENLDI